jgi:ABC-type transport system involved in multi-copper enzyme maturation permease subunit
LILAAVRAEWFKLVRRRALWVTIGLMLVLAVGIEYLLVYVVATHPPARAAGAGVALATARTALYPASVIKKSVASVSSLIGIFALIVGVLAQGSEYSWGTVKTAWVQLPGRISIVLGQLTSLAVLSLIMALGLIAVDSLASYLIGALDAHSSNWPSALDFLKGISAAWLILYLLAVLGFGLATLFKQSAMAVGLGLAYVLVIENLVFSLLGNLGDPWNQIQQWFPISNAGYLQDSFGKASSAVTVTITGSAPATATHAVIVLGLWVIGIAVVSASLVRVRDVT